MVRAAAVLTLSDEWTCPFLSLETSISNSRGVRWIFSELQIRGGIGDNSKIIFLISQQKHML